MVTDKDAVSWLEKKHLLVHELKELLSCPEDPAYCPGEDLGVAGCYVGGHDQGGQRGRQRDTPVSTMCRTRA